VTSARIATLLAAAVVLAPPARSEATPIQDNSFLIEEAYNQEPGVIQHISTFARSTRDGTWGYSFTEEWPVLGQTHQASVTFTAARLDGASSGIGDLSLNYRLQAVGSGDTRVAFSPRLTMVLPTGDEKRGLGSGGVGVQVNLPLSVVLAEQLVSHLNVGGTYVPSVRDATGEKGTSTTFAAGPSLIWLTHPNFNVMCEALYTSTELDLPSGSDRAETFTINPGVRAAINFASGLQVVPGVSVPIGVGPSRGERAIFFYVSFEHPFRLAGAPERT
jgi:hypothetical protein